MYQRVIPQYIRKLVLAQIIPKNKLQDLNNNVIFLFFQFRKGGLIKEKDSERDEWRDEYYWPLCTNGESHNIRRLLLAQIIPKNELLDLADKLHKLRLHLNLNQFCHPQKNEDFTDAYSLQRLAFDKKSRVCNCYFFFLACIT
jgi:hypothetical protein